MKKIIKNGIKYIFIFALIFTLFSCNNNCKKQSHTHQYVDGICSCGEKQEQKFLVTFKNYDGTVLKTEEVVKGQNATAPEVPLREGYLFEKWDVEFTNVTADLVVTAVFVEDIPEINYEEAFAEWLDDFFVLFFEGDQLTCNLLFANPADYGLEHYEATWISYTPFTNEEAIVDFQEIYDELVTFEYNELTSNQQLSYDIIEDFCEYHIDYYSHDYNGLTMSYISSFGGRAADLPSYMTGYIFRNEQDVKDVISYVKSVKDAYPT